MRFSLLPAKPAPYLSLDFVDSDKQHVIVRYPGVRLKGNIFAFTGVELSLKCGEDGTPSKNEPIYLSSEDMEFFSMLTSSIMRAMKFAYQQGRDDAMREEKKKEEAEDGVAFHDHTPRFDLGYLTLPSSVVNACNANAKDLLAEAAEKIYLDFHANEPGQQRQTT